MRPDINLHNWYYTSNCVSRYGIQNLVGNMFEWNSDQCIWTGTTCNVPTSPLDVENSDIDGWISNTIANQQFSAAASSFLPSLGLPWSTSGDGTVSSNSYSDIHFDYININATGTRGFISGGDWFHVNQTGNYNLRVSSTPDYGDFNFGTRCAIELP